MKADIINQEAIHFKLRLLIAWMEEAIGVEFTETSRHRKGTGVHSAYPVRGIDFRMRSFTVGKAIEQIVNDVWEYDRNQPTKGCCLLHGEGANMHLHMQVHPNTKKREA